jgi:hypothetical protein
MTDEGQIGVPSLAGPAAPDAIDESSDRPIGLQLAGALLGAILASVAIVVAIRVDALLVAHPLDSPIATVFGDRGIGVGDPVGLVLVWLVGPLAAAVAGFRFALAAARGVDGSGLWMGAATYVIAIGIAPLTLVPQALAEGTDLLRNLGVVPFLWLFAGAALGPLLAVCLIAGPIWAATLRLTSSGLVRGGPSIRTYPLLPIVILSVCVFLGWAVVMAIIAAIGEVPAD